MFGFGICRLLGATRETLSAEGLTSNILVKADPEVFPDVDMAAGERLRLFDVSFVDDCIFPVIADSSDLVPKLRRVAECVHSIFLHHGIKLNYGSGKTAAICAWEGAGMADARKKLMIDANSRVDCAPNKAPPFTLQW